MIKVITSFLGIAPRIEPQLLPQGAAVDAVNCNFASGAVEPWRNSDIVSASLKSGTVKGLYFYKGQHWLSSTVDTDYVPSLVSGDLFGRLYYTSQSDYPRMLVNEAGFLIPPAPSGNVHKLGLPAPIAPPLLNAVVGGDPKLLEARSYVYTFVSAYGEESAPSPSTAVVMVGVGGSIGVVPVEAPPEYNITNINYYRANSGSATAEFQFVAQTAAGMNLNDNMLSENLSEVLASTLWDMPRGDMMGMVAMANGCMAGFSGNRVCFSEPYLPHAWPRKYEVSVESDIVGLGAFGSSLLVMTTGMPYVITGDQPGAMGREKLEIGYACVSKRGIVDTGSSIIYPSPMGLMLVSSSSVTLITEKIFTQQEWEKLNPSSIVAFAYSGAYVGFYDNGTVQRGFILSKDGNWSWLDFYATAGYYNQATSKLYLVVGGVVHLFDGGTDRLTLTWRSKPEITELAINIGAAVVKADTYPATFNLYADGDLVASRTVANDQMFRLPTGYTAREFAVEVIAAGRVKSVVYAETVNEILAALRSV